MAESSEGEEEGKLTGGNQQLVVDDGLREMAKKAVWSVSSCKPGNGVLALRDDNLDIYWQLFHLLLSSISLKLNKFSLFSTNLKTFFFLFLSVLVVLDFRSDGAQPHLVNIQFQKKVKLQVCLLTSSLVVYSCDNILLD